MAGREITITLRESSGSLFAVVVTEKGMQEITSWYPLKETVKDFVEGGVDISAEIDGPLTRREGGALHGQRFYFHLKDGPKTPPARQETKRLARN